MSWSPFISRMDSNISRHRGQIGCVTWKSSTPIIMYIVSEFDNNRNTKPLSIRSGTTSMSHLKRNPYRRALETLFRGLLVADVSI